ncbi:hypothetical protein [Paenibacillus soyae]|uniref:Uncharacterized protein n=1 Tax=Paenibacillus soyae TaxID=2969249 RepID=A0A9X2SC20_9BACL|nr:hypothetical protein [Paenibacillus soyae]MCR2807620.1 hypothetical protein [Paenibacillus soyae]
MRNFRKHAAPLLALLSSAILVMTLFAMNGARNNGLVELADLQGERSALDGIAVEGMVRDGYHEMQFRLEDSRLMKQTTVYDEPRYLNTYYAPGMPLPVGDRFYEIYPSFSSDTDYEIQYYDNMNGIRGDFGGMALVDTSLVYHGTGDGYTYTNYQEKGLAFIGDRVFYAPPTTRDYTGTSGIYEIVRFSERSTMQGADREEPESRLIAKLDLEGNSRKELKGLEILGLEAVDGKLALIALVDGRIAVRSYNPDSGEMLGEAALDAFVNTTPGQGKQPEAETFQENYEAFADDDTGILTLKLTSTKSTTEDTPLRIFSLSFRDGVTPVYEQALSQPAWKAEPSGEYSGFSFRGGKLYAILTLRSQPPDMTILYDDLKMRSILIEAYEAGQLIYRGELKTDVNDDVVQEQHLTNPSQFQYEPYRYRQVGELHIVSSE